MRREAVKFKVENGVLFYKCLIIEQREEYGCVGVDYDGEDMYRYSDVVEVLGYSEWEQIELPSSK